MSNTQKKNVPELRFPGFEGEWEEKKLGDVATFAKGKLGAKKDVSQNGVPIILYGELYTKYGAIVSKIFSKTDIPENKLKIAKKNDVLIPSSGETAIDIATASCIYLNKGVAVGGDINILTPQKQDDRFISLSINGINKNELSKYAQGKTVVHLYNNDIKNLKIVFPSEFEEQVRIGDFFSKLDRQIELEEQKLELLQQQKKGYMQKIFSQELRFKDENGEEYPEWEEKQLGEVAEIIGGGPPSTKNKLYWNGEINWFSPIEIGNKTYVYSSQKKITEEGLRKSSAKILPVGTILFTSRAGIGKTAILAKESTTNQGFQSIVPRKGVLDSYYVYTISNILKILAEKVSAGSTFSEISKKQMEQLNLNIPMIKEQKNISKFFSKFDNLIEIQERKLKLLKQQKQGLLQKMFI
ncbi:TPA: restriction endonuclease subunit S [Staphylococcus aureus]|uniref:restriction endonuclease subunit S n=2 Tax=Staphylococcus aureus TaxID=1280 RepID=UPI00005FE20F|nr:restriction endonuclease subunit S [Staphylococcus aureus]MBI0978088.1 restriction endonuclease subunit S [Staphylococcus aureus]MBU9752955.1 restriction endonuclease subunit S [Staphylococcus aureus]MBU9757912.1 restriction endonuclease subunit S [Staphylococcus aureus]MBU9778062.1 restriction endonuclease subunit S [Staphylococcus aureus]MBU9786129.1 restriction endonuclease subunit S [Staphylococcus aureus]